ncbi:hypothetical protein HYW18_01965 [Candidatus Uhrbacteria bacterium]|nr:hypothetical protein [Candidatus Uhrbacteria bacterium]
MDASLKRLLSLARKTGHPLIVMGEEESFVLLSPERYETLVDGKGELPKEQPRPAEKPPKPEIRKEPEPPLPPPPPDLESETQFYLEPVE